MNPLLLLTEQIVAANDTISSAAPSVRNGLRELRNFSFNDFVADVSRRLVTFTINLVIAILVFYVGKFIINRLYKFVASILVRRNIDHSLATFALSFVKIVLYFILIVTVIGIIGIETSSFLALFASAGVAIGMALSGTLQNFAGGVLILLLKPYRVGDYIEAQGYAGTVREIQIFHTLITTPDNKAILIPNGGLSTSSVNNWSRESVRRVSWTVAISYGDDVDAARTAILAMLATDPRVINCDPSVPGSCEEAEAAVTVEHHHEEPHPSNSLFSRLFSHRKKMREAIDKWEEERDDRIKALKPTVAKPPAVIVSELADSSVNLSVRAWVASENYWSVLYDYNERIYKELPSHGIHFPFPQLDVHVTNS